MTARYLVGDVFDRLAELEDNSVDLIMSSPPFLALRSYLPADDPNKGKEIGSEPTPAAFIDTLLDVVEACDRVLAPHGTLIFELGDTFSGSGGAGGDYDEDGWRAGQERFRQVKTGRSSAWSLQDGVWLAAMLDAEGAIFTQVDRRDEAERHTPALTIAMHSQAVAERAAHITGVGQVRDKGGGVWAWSAIGQQARYVLLHLWPYLMVKQEQAKAAIEMARHVEECRNGRGKPVTSAQIAYREQIRRFIMNLNEKGGNCGRFPSDWSPPTPHKIALSSIGGSGWPEPKSLCLIPESFRWALVYGRNPFNGRLTPPWRARNVVRWHRPNPPVGALGDKFRPATSELIVACKARDRYFDLDAVRAPYKPGFTGRAAQFDRENRKEIAKEHGDGTRVGNMYDGPGAPPLDTWIIPTAPYKGAHYATYPPDLCVIPVKAMCPERVCRVCGQPSRRIVDGGAPLGRGRSNNGAARGTALDEMNTTGGRIPDYATRVTLGWTDCGHDSWRPGLVLDPFAGSGTTLAVATGHGRDAIGIDIDPRNAQLAHERVGMWLTVEETEAA